MKIEEEKTPGKRGRPRGSKYITKEQAKAARAPQIRSRFFRLVIPNLKQYTNQPDKLNQLKGDTLNLILAKQYPVGLEFYCIAVQTHILTGVPHLDILLLYKAPRLTSLNRFDYLIKHGNLTRYRKLNAAILDYGKKQDLTPLSNLPSDSSMILKIKQIQQDPYRFMQAEMLKSPFHFDLMKYCSVNSCFKNIKSWSSLKLKIKDAQEARCNELLHDKPGFQQITRDLIQSRLSPQELKCYDTWSGYQVIIDHLNQVPRFGYRRPMKTLNLLITGLPDTGKTSLFHNPNHSSAHTPIDQFTSVYPMGMSTWFPRYKSNVYGLILWNEARLTSYSYDLILKLLEGSVSDLPIKGGVVHKRDNPLIVMTSNMTLDQMILNKFGTARSSSFVDLARKNLAVRVTNVIIPQGLNLFLLQKLFVRNA